MNFLNLCKTLARECGASSATLTTVTGASGENARFIEWISQANRDIQSRWGNWKFNFAQLSDNTATGVSTNTAPNDLEIWDRNRFKIDGEIVPSVDYAEWSDFGAVSTGKPSLIVIMPDNSLRFTPTPDAVYTVTGDYYKKPEDLTGNTDIPRMPDTFHDVIWLYAMVNYAYFEAADEVLGRAKDRLSERLPALEASQLPFNHHYKLSHSDLVIRAV